MDASAPVQLRTNQAKDTAGEVSYFFFGNNMELSLHPLGPSPKPQLWLQDFRVEWGEASHRREAYCLPVCSASSAEKWKAFNMHSEVYGWDQQACCQNSGRKYWKLVYKGAKKWVTLKWLLLNCSSSPQPSPQVRSLRTSTKASLKETVQTPTSSC